MCLKPQGRSSVRSKLCPHPDEELNEEVHGQGQIGVSTLDDGTLKMKGKE